MQLAICIPVYQVDIRDLCKDILAQISNKTLSIELIFIDDFSRNSIREKNKSVEQFHCKYIELRENIGRSAIRNEFLKYTGANYLLFLDCDSKIIRDNFIDTYIENINKLNPECIYGGRIFSKKPNQSDLHFRWEYGVQKESLSVEKRIKIGPKALMANNLLIRRDVFINHPFETKLKKYGHEDTLFAFQLNTSGISVCHLDNPILNNEIDDYYSFLKKTKEGIENLLFIHKEIEPSKAFRKFVQLTRVYDSSIILRKVLQLLAPLFIPLLEKYMQRMPSFIAWFAWYKLFYLSYISNKNFKS